MPAQENKHSLARWLLVSTVLAATVAAPACSGGREKEPAGSRSYQTDKTQLTVKPGVVIDLDIAKTEDARKLAPKDLPGLCEACGLLLAYGAEQNNRFSTEGMRMDVDLVWMNRFSVIGIATDLKAPVSGQPVSTSLSPGKATELLILSAGGVSRLGISQGMNLQLLKL